MKRTAEFRRRVTGLGDEQNAGGVAVNAMNETRAFTAETVGHVFEHAVDMFLGAGAALHREAKRLVEHEHVLVLVDDHFFDEIAVALRDAERRLQTDAGFFRLAYNGGYADFHAHFQAVVGLRAFGIDPHLPRTQQLLQIAVTDFGEVHAEPAVEPHLAFGLADANGFNFCTIGGAGAEIFGGRTFFAHTSTVRATQNPASKAMNANSTEPNT